MARRRSEPIRALSASRNDYNQSTRRCIQRLLLIFHSAAWGARARVGWLGGAIVAGLLTACGPAGSPTRLAVADFEDPGPVNGPPPALPGFTAHSGANVLTVATGAEFADILPAQPLRALCPAGRVPRRLRVQAWVWVPSGRIRNTILVAAVNCAGRRRDVWQGLAINQVVRRFHKWEKVQLTVPLPADLQPTDHLTIYCWHQEANGEATYIDDVEVVAWL